VSWAPVLPQDENQPNINAKRIVSGGCEDTIKIWRYKLKFYLHLYLFSLFAFKINFASNFQREESNGQWSLEHTLNGHNDWVRDVAWSPNVLHSKTNIASCSQV
jgi:protein transport protein SEC13